MEFFNVFSGIIGCGGIAVFILILNKLFNKSININEIIPIDLSEEKQTEKQEIEKLKQQNKDLKQEIEIKLKNINNKETSIIKTNEIINRWEDI